MVPLEELRDLGMAVLQITVSITPSPKALERQSTGCSLKEDPSMEAQKDMKPFNATNLRKWEGNKALMGLISMVTFYNKDLPVLSRERRRRGKEQETELIKLLSHLRSWDSFSKEGGLLGPKDT